MKHKMILLAIAALAGISIVINKYLSHMKKGIHVILAYIEHWSGSKCTTKIIIVAVRIC